MANLISALNIGRSALRAQTAALQTTGQNIANAATPGYSRQRVDLQTALAEPQPYGFLGQGVQVAQVERVVDEALEGFLRDSRSNLATLAEQEKALSRIEGVFNSLGDSSLSSLMGDFFSAVEKLTASPEDRSVRSDVVQTGQALADAFNNLDTQLKGLQRTENRSVESGVIDLNTLTSQIADLNAQIVSVEGGGQNVGDANDLRDQRTRLLGDLADLVDIHTVESRNGSINVTAGNDFLVYEDQSYELETEQVAQNGLLVSQIRFAMSQKALTLTGGRLEGQVLSRDQNIDKFLNDINGLANAIISNINRVHSQGAGLEAYQEITGLNAAERTNVPLNDAGLPFEVENGAFTLHARNRVTGEVTDVSVPVDVDGLNGDDTTLQGLMSEINRLIKQSFEPEDAPLRALITGHNELQIQSTRDGWEFDFGEDTSGVLSALGVNVFFEGSGAMDMRVRQALVSNPGLLTAARSAASGDNTNAVALAALRDTKLMGEATFEEFMQGTVGQLGILTKDAQRRVENQQVLTTQLANEREAISGVSLDEEALELVKHQRAFQGAARYISVVDSLLETLLNAL